VVVRLEGDVRVAQAERLLWRAGFGPRPARRRLSRSSGSSGAVHSLDQSPGRRTLVGPAPHDEKGFPLAPYDAWGHDHLWWLDRMIRTSRPLVERMALIWHDWFATSNDGVGSQRLMLKQNDLFRQKGLGSFHDLLVAVTATRDAPLAQRRRQLEGLAERELRPRDDGALHARPWQRLHGDGRPRAGPRAHRFRYDWADDGPANFRYDVLVPRHGREDDLRLEAGHFAWKRLVPLCVSHPAQAAFLRPEALELLRARCRPDNATRRACRSLYVASGTGSVPVVEAILKPSSALRGGRGS
jgi:hypothetical protein